MADPKDWDEHFADVLCYLDDPPEHLVIVPIESEYHPERNRQWEMLMGSICFAASSTLEPYLPGRLNGIVPHDIKVRIEVHHTVKSTVTISLLINHSDTIKSSR